jgi:hypothetical protein
MTSHRMLIKDPVTRRGTCSECGDTPITKKGAYWRCAQANRKAVSSWRKREPTKAHARDEKASRKQVGKVRLHEVTDKDMGTLTGQCRSCGPVTIVRSGRGWACFTGANNGCLCSGTIRWAYEPAGLSLCELCCFALARGFVSQGLLEPVLELTWPESRTSWETAMYELEGA